MSKDEVPQRLRMFFENLDKDHDGKLTKDEAKGLTDLLGRGLGGFGGAGGAGGAGGDKPPGKKKDAGK